VCHGRTTEIVGAIGRLAGAAGRAVVGCCINTAAESCHISVDRLDGFNYQRPLWWSSSATAAAAAAEFQLVDAAETPAAL